ncbi:hypothetical protein DVH24_006441 [Malus domestica]|uniref:Uncharacterized protein n=1 Tax=Malus domestica TaxID=3750 RepID=A0A498KFJ3_MALDO|nr:hypothetical protein DVH24_006441 [Malus domestica]
MSDQSSPIQVPTKGGLDLGLISKSDGGYHRWSDFNFPVLLLLRFTASQPVSHSHRRTRSTARQPPPTSASHSEAAARSHYPVRQHAADALRFCRMRHAKEEASCSATQVIDLVSAVKELHGINSQELNKLPRDSESFTIQYVTEKGSISKKIDVEKLAGFLPLHLIAVLMSSDRDEALFKYLSCGIRLLHSLCDLAPRHAKLEQVLLDDVKVSEQLLDLKNHNFGMAPLMQSALVACSLHLLTVCISSQWQDLVQVLLAHPKVDVFMDAAFGAVCVSMKFLKIKLSAQQDDFCTKSSLTSEQIVHSLCQQCEASLQFLQLLCQQKLFRERLLRNKELCGKGGVLFLAQAILKLNVVPQFATSARVVAAVSRLKAKILSMLLSLSEAESMSYLDEVSSSPASLDLAKSVVLEVLEVMKTAFGKDPRSFAAFSDRSYPVGLLQLNAMRLADIFSDDSNFRSYMTHYFTKVITAIFLLPHGDFVSCWCSSELPLKEEDGSIEYDSFATAGWVLDVSSSVDQLNATSLEFPVTPSIVTQASYSHQRTALFVKIIANLHCFIPTVCEEQERNHFVNKFLEYVQMDLSNTLPGFSLASDTPKAATVCRNLRSLLSHAESLIPNFLNEEDVQLLRQRNTRSQCIEINLLNSTSVIIRLNNRKARLARTAKDVRATPEADNALPEKQAGRGQRSNVSPDSPGGDASAQQNARRDPQIMLRPGIGEVAENNVAETAGSSADFAQCKQGDSVVLVGANGEQIGIGKVFQVRGQWYGRNLEELRAYVVDVKELKARRSTRLPHPSMATGVSFEEAETKIGVMRVLWDSNMTFLYRPQ